VAETAQDAFDRGRTAGEIAETLRRHDQHLGAINGSTEKTALALESLAQAQHKMAMQLQRLADQAESDAKTRVATASALKDAEEARRNVAETKWTPVARMVALVSVTATVAGLIIAFYGFRGR
jgi:hypothetical protein